MFILTIIFSIFSFKYYLINFITFNLCFFCLFSTKYLQIFIMISIIRSIIVPKSRMKLMTVNLEPELWISINKMEFIIFGNTWVILWWITKIKCFLICNWWNKTKTIVYLFTFNQWSLWEHRHKVIFSCIWFILQF